MSVSDECRAVLPVVLRESWRRGSPERLGRLLQAAIFLFLGLVLASLAPAIFALQDDELRRNLLNLLAALAVLGWLVTTILGRTELARHFDFRGLLTLPLSFRTLYALRVGAGLSGPWLGLFGPLILYLLAARTAGLPGAAVALLATVGLIVLLGRVVAIILLKLDRLNASWLTTAVMLVLVLAALFAFEPLMKDRILDLTELALIDQIGDQVRASRLLLLAGYLPGGVLAAIFEAPRDLDGNLARLLWLWLAAVACMLVEYRILRKESVASSTGSGDTVGVHLPLARFLRQMKRFRPSACLTLIEFDSMLRLKWVRGILLFSAWAVPTLQTGRLFSLFQVLIVVGFLLSLRNNVYGTAHRSIAERFLLPVRLIDLATAGGKALTFSAAFLFGLAVLWAWQRVGWPGAGAFVLWLALPACLLVAGIGFGAYSSVRWPFPVDLGPYAAKPQSDAGAFFATLGFGAATIGPPFLLDLLMRSASWGPPAALYGGLALILGSVAAATLGVRAADRLARADPHRMLDALLRRQKDDEASGFAG